MKKNQKILLWLLIITILSVGYLIEEKENVKIVNTQNVSNKKIGWGIKRANNHEQPDLGSKNIKMLKENNGIAIGNKESKKIYLTFDEGYEAGYTTQILQTLKEENVKALIFCNPHNPVGGKMIEEGHIIRKPHYKT